MTTIRLDVNGPLARVTLDRPEVLNAGNAQWVRDLGDVVARIERTPDVRVVVLTGAGRAFCTGVDLDALASGAFGLSDFVAWEDAMIAIERMDRLVIAGINGHCLGGGLQLALVCDYRLASDTARLGLPAVKECLIPSMSLYRLPRLIGAARARELILLGEPIDAPTAERIGLVNRVVPAAALMTEARQLAAMLASKAPLAVRYILDAVNQGLQMPLAQAQRLEATLFGLVAATDDMHEGTRAFLEKRKPEFKGQ
jgi:enoyl-CoA hydratase/carnithine racemase